MAATAKVTQLELSPLTSAIPEGRVTFTPDLAKRVLDEANYQRQRTIKPTRLWRQVTRLQRPGQWDPDFSIRFMRFGGQLILVDGQHRLAAIVETQIAASMRVVVTLAQTWAEVNAAYARIDVDDGNRSATDILNATDPTAGREIGSELRSRAFSAVETLANNFPHKRLNVGESAIVTKDDRLAALSFWLDELEIYDDIIKNSQRSLRNRMRQPGIVAVALATLNGQPDRAQIFWRIVGENKLLKPGDPEQAFVNFLLVARMNIGAHIAERGATQAWNAWFHGRRLQQIKRDAERQQRPIVIDGTRFRGRA